jgi:hypothetical protein
MTTDRTSRNTAEPYGLAFHWFGDLAADSAYGSAEMLGWLVNERTIEPHI